MRIDSTFSRQSSDLIQSFFRKLPVLVTLLLVGAAVLGWVGYLLGGLPGWAAALLDRLSNFSAVFLGIFIEAAPFLLLGTLASGVVEVFIGRDDLARWFPRQPVFGALAGSLFGLFFPVCECGVVPFTRRLLHKGVPIPAAVATLLAAPVINPIVIAATLAAFGPGPVFWGRIGLTLLIAILTGLLFSLRPNAAAWLREVEPPVPPDLTTTPLTLTALPTRKEPLSERFKRVLLVAADEFFEMGRFLVLGALLAALMQTFVSQAALLNVSQGSVTSVLALTGLAVLLSICSTVDAFIALAFAGTFTTGSVLAFLVFGPMVDIKSTLMFLRVFKPRGVAFLALVPLTMTLILTILINVVGLW